MDAGHELICSCHLPYWCRSKIDEHTRCFCQSQSLPFCGVRWSSPDRERREESIPDRWCPVLSLFRSLFIQHVDDLLAMFSSVDCDENDYYSRWYALFLSSIRLSLFMSFDRFPIQSPVLLFVFKTVYQCHTSSKSRFSYFLTEIFLELKCSNDRRHPISKTIRSEVEQCPSKVLVQNHSE
jgi:hypothetical protein